MPLYYQQDINQFEKLAIWKIEEPLSFFENKVKISKTFGNLEKQIQHAAGRYLLQFLQPNIDINNIVALPNQKPFFKNCEVFFSISHTKNWVACIISSQKEVGIDIEICNPKIEQIAAKFLSDIESIQIKNNCNLQNYLQYHTLYWCAKETMFKWWGKGKVDYKKMIKIQEFSIDKQQYFDCIFETNQQSIKVPITYKIFDNFILTFT
jgi:phosphopantetheinyl transferase